MDWEPTPPATLDEVDPKADGVLSPTTATGLVFGIQSDTANLTKGCSAEEFDAAAYLFPGIDEDRLDRIANPEVDAEVLDVKARAISEREVRNAFTVSDVGTVSNLDAIPQAADELLRLEGVTAVVVMGDRDGNLHISGRSRDDRVHMGKTLSAVIEDIPMSDAGGHARMGGGQVSLDHLAGIGPSNGRGRSDFTEELFSAMAGDV
jgi:nanoRNase/pAp phosphatase (c-di-AMP/oligoRNAs hydrolase)